jgi:hypothetical protein
VSSGVRTGAGFFYKPFHGVEDVIELICWNPKLKTRIIEGSVDSKILDLSSAQPFTSLSILILPVSERVLEPLSQILPQRYRIKRAIQEGGWGGEGSRRCYHHLHNTLGF